MFGILPIMDQVASLLLSFPPNKDLSDNEHLNLALKSHVKHLNQFKQNEPALLAAHAPSVLQHVDMVLNSVSYAYLLDAIFSNPKNSNLPDDLAECTAKFLLTFDTRQIRYVGSAFSSVLGALQNSGVFPPSVAVELTAAALLRLDPSGSMLTSHHLPLLQQAYHTQNIQHILPIVNKSIVFYPGMRGQTETRPLYDTRLPPSAYISIESGLTARVSASEVLEYDLLCGLIHMTQRDWHAASAAFERVCTFPSRDGGCSTLMPLAYNKWILVNLIIHGKLRPIAALGALTPMVQRTFQTMSKPYVALAKAFEKTADEGGAGELKTEIETPGPGFWEEEQNGGLVREIQQHYQRHNILRLREVYSKIGLEDIRMLTHSAEVGGPLSTTAEVESLLRSMIASGMLAGAIEGSGDKLHLSFLPDGGEEEMSEARFADELRASHQRLHDLAPIVRATDERLATSRDYVRQLVREQKREKDGTAGTGPNGGLQSTTSWLGGASDFGFDESQIEDEDLMTGVQLGAPGGGGSGL